MKQRRKRSGREAPAVCETCEVASATECTGLMPALPEDMAEDESRAALYAIHSAKGARPREDR